jgi:hypothetical protein
MISGSLLLPSSFIGLKKGLEKIRLYGGLKRA